MALTLGAGSVRRASGVLTLACMGLGLGAGVLVAFQLPMRERALLIAGLALPFVVLMIGQTRRLLLGLMLLDVSLQADVHLWFRESAAAFGAVGGVNVSLSTVCLALLYAEWLGRFLGRIGELPESRWGLCWAPALYVLIMVLSIAVALDPVLVAFQLALAVQLLLMLVYVVHHVRTRADLTFLLSMLLLGLCIESLLMIVTRLTGNPNLVPGLPTRIDVEKAAAGGFIRIGGTGGGPNATASYLSMFLAPAVAVLTTDAGRRLKAVAALALVLGGTALLLTLSRGGWAAALISLLLAGWVVGRRSWGSGPTAAATLGVAAVVLLAQFIGVAFRDPTADAGAAAGRVPLLDIAMRVIADHPVLGVGANNYTEVLPAYVTLDLGGEWRYVVHNTMLLVWAETGTLGLVTFLVFVGVSIRSAWQAWTLGRRFEAHIAFGCLAAVMGHLVHMQLDVFNGRFPVQPLWLVSGLALALKANAEAVIAHPAGRASGAREAWGWR